MRRRCEGTCYSFGFPGLIRIGNSFEGTLVRRQFRCQSCRIADTFARIWTAEERILVVVGGSGLLRRLGGGLRGNSDDVGTQLYLGTDDIVDYQPAEYLLAMLVQMGPIWFRGGVLRARIRMSLGIELICFLLGHARKQMA